MSIVHGANIFEISTKLKIEKNNILDFSSNINPFGGSLKAKRVLKKNIDMVSLYPDVEYKKLKDAISLYAECNKENIILGSGATELISTYISTIKPRSAILLSPVYSEYEEELEKIECKIHKFYYKKKNDFKIDIEELNSYIKEIKPELIIICNPNNPTGTTIKKSELENILKKYNEEMIFSCGKKGNIMIDETYIEFTDLKIYSSVDLVRTYNNIFIIRGTSKFFSTPGIRLGYGILGKSEEFEKMKNSSNLWNINICATIMGEVMFKDVDYIEESKKKIRRNFDILRKKMKKISEIKVYDSKSNFILCEILENKKTSEELYKFMLKNGIIIRDASNFFKTDKNFFRVCILGRKENLKLINKLEEFFE